MNYIMIEEITVDEATNIYGGDGWRFLSSLFGCNIMEWKQIILFFL